MDNSLNSNLVGERIGMLLADAIHEFGQIPFTLVAEQVIYLTEVSLVGRHFQRDIENQRLEQVQFRIEPEGILHFSAGAFQDNICEGLGHQLTGADLTKAVPGVAMFHRNQVENLHCITTTLSQCWKYCFAVRAAVSRVETISA